MILYRVASFNDLEGFKEILLTKGSITIEEVNNIVSLFDKELKIDDKTKIVEELLDSYPIFRKDTKA